MIFRKSTSIHISEHPGHKQLSLFTPPSEYKKPEMVYIPLVEGDPCEAVVAVGDHVLVGQVVAQRKGRFGLPLHASVSGEVTSISKKMWHASGMMVNMIEIKNDFKETLDPSIKPNDVAKLTPSQMIEIVKNCGIVGLGGSGFPTFVKYSSKCEIHTLIVNAVECEPYLTADYVLLKQKTDELIRGIQYAMKMSGASHAYICIKQDKVQAIALLEDHLQDHISIFPVKDVYPAGWEKYLVQRVTNQTYKMLPSEVGVVVNNAATLIAMCAAIEENQPLVEKMVTFTGQGLAHPQNVLVKIGTLANEVIRAIGGYADGVTDANFIVGGPMTGRTLLFDSVVIHRSLGGIVVMPKESSAPALPCMGCGKCVEICPVFLSPVLIKNAVDKKDKDLMIALKADKCMMCGLCSYICPSRIELTDAMSKARATVLKR
ncbi:MAG: RnfABCDGE type electron transport complex subunit C [Bacilli bacterium]